MHWRLPVGAWGEICFNYLTSHLSSLFAIFKWLTITIDSAFRSGLTSASAVVMILLMAALSWWAAGWRLAVLTLIGFWLTTNQGLWDASVKTMALVLTATILSMLVAIPLGIVLGMSALARTLIYPVLDFVQTMPRFVYLIPAAIMFGIDIAPAVFATMTLAVPPPARLIATGLLEVDKQMVESAEAFGCTPRQVLTKVLLPLAMPSILLGLNQCLMMALSMAVISSLIGAGGLGAEILTAISSLDAGRGVVAGLAIFVLAIFLDRTSQGVAAKWSTLGHRRAS